MGSEIVVWKLHMIYEFHLVILANSFFVLSTIVSESYIIQLGLISSSRRQFK